ncbi:hypothetical protein [Ensifer sp. B1-9]|uniref:hypothetical protein n=1 Tax=Ensifer sp. B1-9 TaxID=3141455 RepID=UPI0028BB8605
MKAEEQTSTNGGRDQRYDLLVPLDIPASVDFIGRSARHPIALNVEIGFSFAGWDASFHRLEQTAYLIIRVNCGESDLEVRLRTVLHRLSWAAARLDISMRPVQTPIKIVSSGGHVDLAHISAFPAGETPLASVRHDSYSVGLPVTVLSDAVAEVPEEYPFSEALRVFSDVDFEVSLAARFINLSTIIELIAARAERDPQARDLLKKWIDEANALGRNDLANALDTMRVEPISAAIARMVEEAARTANCSEEEVAELKKRARTAYRRRSSVLHEGK